MFTVIVVIIFNLAHVIVYIELFRLHFLFLEEIYTNFHIDVQILSLA